MNEYMPLRELVFTTLRQAILKGELDPGERLMEIQLADKLGVSRTPIREAIRKLEKEGLVRMIPRKGAVVAGISEKMLTDVLEVRMTLEKMAFTLSVERGKPDFADRLEAAEKEFAEAVAKGDIVEMSSKDEAFHFVIYDETGNEKLKELLYALRENMYRYRMEYLKESAVHQVLMDEHEEIIRCIRERNLDTGLEMIEKHIANQETQVISRIHS